MLSGVSKRLCRDAGQFLRTFTASSAAFEVEVSSVDSFRTKLAKVAPNLEPMFASDFMPTAKIGTVDGPTPSKLKMSFSMPHGIIMSDEEVDMALIPAVSGDFGVMPGHVPVVAELRPGVVSIHKEMDKDIIKYFVSGGFAVAHVDSSVEVTVVEACKLEDLDPAAVKSGLAEYTARLATAAGKNDDLEAAIAQVGVEMFSAMDSALATN